MKNVILYALGFFVIATAAAQAAPGKSAADRKAVGLARVKLMNDARKFGPQSAQVVADRAALVTAMEKLKGDMQPAKNHPVNVKRLPAKGTKMSQRISRKKIQHRGARKHTRVTA